MTGAIQSVQSGAVRTLTLNRPEKANALSPDLVDELSRALEAIAQDPKTNVVVITGTGRAFSAGLDLKHLLTLVDAQRRTYLGSVLDMFLRVWRLPQPVIAAVNGAAVAGGFDLSVFCDLRIVAEEAVFAQTEILIGVNPISNPLFHIIGLGAARELGYLGEKISAAEAHRIGLVNRIVPGPRLMDEALAWAATLASRPQAALVETKRLTREMLGPHVESSVHDFGKRILDAMATPEQRTTLTEYVGRMGSKGR